MLGWAAARRCTFQFAPQHSCAVQIHYGCASLSALSRLSCYFVFRRLPLDTAAVAKQTLRHAAGLQRQGIAAVLVLLDQPFSHAAASLQQAVDADRLMQTAGKPATGDSSGIQIIVARSQPGSLDPVERSAAEMKPSPAGSACCSSGVSATPSDRNSYAHHVIISCTLLSTLLPWLHRMLHMPRQHAHSQRQRPHQQADHPAMPPHKRSQGTRSWRTPATHRQPLACCGSCLLAWPWSRQPSSGWGTQEPRRGGSCSWSTAGPTGLSSSPVC